MHSELPKRKNSKKDSDTNKNIVMFFVPLGLQLVIYVFACILSFTFDFSDKHYRIIFLIYISIASFISGLIIVAKKRQKGMLNAVLYNLPATMLVLLTSFILNGFTLNLQICFSIFLSVLFAAAGGILSVNRKKKIKHKR